MEIKKLAQKGSDSHIGIHIKIRNHLDTRYCNVESDPFATRINDLFKLGFKSINTVALIGKFLFIFCHYISFKAAVV
jgi:hypothetical protein